MKKRQSLAFVLTLATVASLSTIGCSKGSTDKPISTASAGATSTLPPKVEAQEKQRAADLAEQYKKQAQARR